MIALFVVIRITGRTTGRRLRSFTRLKAVATLIFLMADALDGHRFLNFLILVVFASIVLRLVSELLESLIDGLNLTTLLLESRESLNYRLHLLLAQLRFKRALRHNNVSSLLLGNWELRNTKLRI